MTDWPSKDEQITAQEATIKALWVKVADFQVLQQRVEKLQAMHEANQEYIKKLKAQLTPEAKAQWIFQEAEQCQKNERS